MHLPSQVRANTVVLGPCPGCDDWQLDYTDQVAQTYIGATVDEEYGIQVDVQPWYDVIEQILEDHLEECPHLRDLLEASWSESQP